MTDEDFLRIAMQAAHEAVKQGDMPFGACVINERGFVLSVAHNRVNASMDPTAHAEVLAIREAGQKRGSPDLRGCVLYTTCEPCAMCFSACVWSKRHELSTPRVMKTAQHPPSTTYLFPACR